ncbi:blood vessel epicardial substance-like [Amphibalanus amphitrite]|uniref:blood vessel epicardial substance-like n=1 Tax=Amphibalanus amphitrite TaxID=1232801 RepID=UPI001C91C984|nr:blood vessel epicardial substance-like [Amphibalanus amphitrite]
MKMSQITQLSATISPLLSTTADPELDEPKCVTWPAVHQNLFQVANLFYLAAFVVPHTFRGSAAAMRALLCLSQVLLACWAGGYICAPDALGWSLALLAANLVHIGHAGWLERPSPVPAHLKELHRKLFVPLRVDNREFGQLTRGAEHHSLPAAQAYAVEAVTATTDRLSVLLTGKLEVLCDGIHLHYVIPNQFIDSPEWESERAFRDRPNESGPGPGVISSVSPRLDPDDVYQVSIVAVEDSTYLTWSSSVLTPILRNSSFLNAVIHNLVGKDISQKLYRVAEGLGGSRHWDSLNAGRRCSGPFSPIQLRSNSVDRVHTGTKGLMRSQVWLGNHSRRGSHAAAGADALVNPAHRRLYHFH